ncbi:PD-(D/E)XK nuclease family protein [Paenarthrobacter sp. Z7-10]|uniref:PD-(D/E)XK nuclease family protein n=1 Tax=Paenarthrobacter sp. Z7-10 TaxID=2787635 RepID=UPI0022A8D97C|nr:PD-(D/E)XK nuclease family protein [Paenarthrobacter sp. Z7-10]MCZ2404988.1 PD-(D/E)XK nuclease family protein [Paenarthrobacter sp. Z7-10]
MIIEFGWFLDRAPWAFAAPGLNRVRVGRKNLIGLLQTRLGLTRPDTPNAERVSQYLQRLQSIDSPAAWFHASFAVDAWSTAQELLAARDDAVTNGWDGRLPEPLPDADDDGPSPLLPTLAAAERAEGGLAPSLADDLVEILDELQASPLPLGIDELVLQHPEATFPAVWRRLIAALRSRGVHVSEAARPETQPQLTILNAETEWEAAEHTARWLAAANNGRTAVVCSDSTSVLDQYLTALGQPRLGAGAQSPWQAQDQLIPLFFELIWAPVNVYLLAEFLTLPDTPVRHKAGRSLLRALREEPGTGGEAWLKAVAEIAGDVDLGPALAATLDTAFNTGLLPASGSVDGRSLLAAAQWFAATVNARAAVEPRLQATTAQLKRVLALLEPLPDVSRQDLRRIIAAVVTPASESILPAEAAPWLRLNHLVELGEDVEDALWWGFKSATTLAVRRWEIHDVRTLARAGVHLPSPEDLTALAVEQTVACAGHARRLLIVQIAQRNGERLNGNPLLEGLVARQPAPTGHTMEQRILDRSVPAESLTGEDGTWKLTGRTVRLTPAQLRRPEAPAPVQEVGANQTLIPQTLSFSQLNTLLGCSLSWVLQYKSKLRIPDAAQIPSENRMLGSFAHKVVEVLHGQLYAENRAVPSAEEVRNAIEQLLPHFASELLLPGEKARRHAVQSTLETAVATFFEQLQRGGVALQGMEEEFRKELRLTAGGTEHLIPVSGRADAVGIDDAGRRTVVDLKWSNSDKYRRAEIQDGEALQLALYQWALGDGDSPSDDPTAYYLFKQRSFASAHGHFGAKLPRTQEPSELWRKTVRSAEFTLDEVLAGRVTAAKPAEDALPADGLDAPAQAAEAGRLYVKPNCRYCNFGTLCGLKGDFS